MESCFACGGVDGGLIPRDSVVRHRQRQRPGGGRGWMAVDECRRAAGGAYSDTNYIVVGMLVKKVCGRPSHEYVREELLAEHDLEHDLEHTEPTDRRRIPSMAQGHVVAGRQIGIPEYDAR